MGRAHCFHGRRCDVIPIDRYSLEPHAGPYSSWPLDSALRVNGTLTQARVPGYVVEAQYETSLGDVLVTSYDCPFEEASVFVLLDRSYAIVSRAKLVVPYGSFLLHAHWPMDASTVGLHYYGDMFYTLRVVARGGLFGCSPKLKLRSCLDWKQDARMDASHQLLQKTLAEIDAAFRTDCNGL
jgi:hypothetical protein